MDLAQQNHPHDHHDDATHYAAPNIALDATDFPYVHQIRSTPSQLGKDEIKTWMLGIEQETKLLRQRYPLLNAIVHRQSTLPDSLAVDIEKLQQGGFLPEMSSEYRTLLNPQRAALPETACKDGHLYCFRGDYPDLEKRGIYSGTIARWNLSLDELLTICADETLLSHLNFRVANKLEEFMWIQSNGGGEAFVSTTTDFDVAQRHPDYQHNGTVYVIRVPIESAFRNYASVVHGRGESEILIPDMVKPGQIIDLINPRSHTADIRDYL